MVLWLLKRGSEGKLMRNKKIMLIFLLFFLTLLAWRHIAFAQRGYDKQSKNLEEKMFMSYVCYHPGYNIERKVRLVYENVDSFLPCQAYYLKPDEGLPPQRIAYYVHEDGMCEQHVSQLLNLLRDNDWDCMSSKL